MNDLFRKFSFIIKLVKDQRRVAVMIDAKFNFYLGQPYLQYTVKISFSHIPQPLISQL